MGFGKNVLCLASLSICMPAFLLIYAYIAPALMAHQDVHFWPEAEVSQVSETHLGGTCSASCPASWLRHQSLFRDL